MKGSRRVTKVEVAMVITVIVLFFFREAVWPLPGTDATIADMNHMISECRRLNQVCEIDFVLREVTPAEEQP